MLKCENDLMDEIREAPNVGIYLDKNKEFFLIYEHSEKQKVSYFLFCFLTKKGDLRKDRKHLLLELADRDPSVEALKQITGSQVSFTEKALKRKLDKYLLSKVGLDKK